MNDSRSHELKALDGMNNLRLWTIWMILGYELRVLGVMNNGGL